jgi:Uncharacterized protein conserved in bacteria (DUF2252)
MAAFSTLTHEVDGHARIVDQSPLIIPISQLAETEPDELYEGLRRLLDGYRNTLEYHRRILLDQFQLADVAPKVVGVGSVGTRARIALMVGRDGLDLSCPGFDGGSETRIRSSSKELQVHAQSQEVSRGAD